MVVGSRFIVSQNQRIKDKIKNKYGKQKQNLLRDRLNHFSKEQLGGGPEVSYRWSFFVSGSEALVLLKPALEKVKPKAGQCPELQFHVAVGCIVQYPSSLKSISPCAESTWPKAPWTQGSIYLAIGESMHQREEKCASLSSVC